MIISNCNVSKLHDEFIKSGINPFPVFDKGNNTGDFTFIKNTDMELVQQIIDNHDPTPLPSPKNEVEILKDRLEATEDTLIHLMMEG